MNTSVSREDSLSCVLEPALVVTFAEEAVKLPQSAGVALRLRERDCGDPDRLWMDEEKCRYFSQLPPS